jgi:hypothetical protein
MTAKEALYCAIESLSEADACLSFPPFAFDLQLFRLSCSGPACLRARYSTARVRERLNIQAENALSEVSGDYFILQPDLRFLAPNWKRQPSTIENCF